MHWKVLSFACAAVLAAAGDEPKRLRRRRMSPTWSERQRHMWERCDKLDRENTGCNLTERMQCDSRLSDGPNDATTQIRLRNLPASTAEEPVHVQWWAARESPSEYDPLEGPWGSSIYRSVLDAYPKYWEPDFNGGNVLVGLDGEATIRVRAPATYQVYCWLLYPHIHLRVCRGSSFFRNFTDSLLITGDGIVVLSTSQELEVVNATAYVPPATTTRAPTTTLPVVTTSTPLYNDSIAVQAGAIDLRIQDAKSALDTDALEFSPVYQCFLLGHFFDQFSSDCAEECPPGSEVSHGQCVRASLEVPSESFRVSWHLEADCGSKSCWTSKKNQTLHFIRLEVADHLDIPFQEVVNVRLGFTALLAEGRRLSQTHSGRLEVTVLSGRIDAHEGRSFLEDDFFVGTEDVSELLGVEVSSCVVAGTVEETTEGSSEESSEMGQGTDPYGPAYEDLDTSPGGTWLSTSPGDNLPPMVVVGVAGALLLVLGISAGWVYYRKKRDRHQQTQQAQLWATPVQDLKITKVGSGQFPLEYGPLDKPPQSIRGGWVQ